MNVYKVVHVFGRLGGKILFKKFKQGCKGLIPNFIFKHIIIQIILTYTS